MENLYYKNENIDGKYVDNMWNYQFLKVKSLELDKDIMELKNKELKDRKERIKWEIEELIHKLINVSNNDMD